MALTKITSDQVSQDTAFTLQSNLVTGSVTITNTSVIVGVSNTMTINSVAITFPDSTTQTVAGVDSGTALAYAIALG